jgi:hypothetical protein
VEPTRATGDQKSLGASEVHVRASAGDAEYFDAAMRGSLLRRIAEDTGGRFFTPSNAALLPEAVTYTGRGVTVVEERDLWDMPILLLLLLGLLGVEWASSPSEGWRDRDGAATRGSGSLCGPFRARSPSPVVSACRRRGRTAHLLVITGSAETTSTRRTFTSGRRRS